MFTFLSENRVLAVELPELKRQAMARLKWSETAWWNKNAGRSQVSEAERLALEVVLTEIRKEVEAGTLTLARSYNK